MEHPLMSDMPAFPAPAKLNLFLHVVGRRPDGYHLLQTLFRFLDVGDELRIAVRPDGIIRLLNPLPGVPETSDLCHRAASLLREHAGCRLGADIHLNKRLPMGGGLGGGSSDAATVLLALNRLWGLDLPGEALQALGIRLGADVPVFLFGHTAFAEGVGERLTAVDLPPASYVVLIPPVQVATREIFMHPGLTRNTPEMTIAALRHRDGGVGGLGFGHNDMQAVVVKEYPVVGEYLAWLDGRAEARMTGSGCCVFAAFPDRVRAEAVFDARPEGVQGFVADGLDVHPLRPAE